MLHEYRIIIGIEKRDNGMPIGKALQGAIRESIAIECIGLVGGYTFYDSVGGWMDGNNLVEEKGLVISIFADLNKALALAARIQKIAKQKCICLIHPDGHVDFIGD